MNIATACMIRDNDSETDHIPSADEVSQAIEEALKMNENMRLYGTIDCPTDSSETITK